MLPTEPLPLHHSWPIADRSLHFDLGLAHDVPPMVSDAPGSWRCELAGQALTWSDAVYDLFGLPRGASVTRREAVALYAEESRAAMERLRRYAIRHRRGFTLDVELRPASGMARWMRLMAAPVCTGATVTAIEGVKHDVTALYR